MSRYLTAAETAKMLRAELKRTFPGTTFRVQTKTYAGGASIRVQYTDGPSEPEVKAITRHYEGTHFDGMIDLDAQNRTWLLPNGTLRYAGTYGTEGSGGVIPAERIEKPDPNAEEVRLLSDAVFLTRRYSVPFLDRVTVSLCARFGWDVPEVVDLGWGAQVVTSDYRIREEVWRAASALPA